MPRISSGLTGQHLSRTVQAEENRGLSIQDLAIKCGYITEKGTARVPQFKVAVADASGVYFGKTIPGDVPAQRSGTSNRYKAQKNGILVTAKRFLAEIDVPAGTYANVVVAEVGSDVIDVSDFNMPEGTKVVIIVKNHDPVSDDDEDSEDDEGEVEEEEVEEEEEEEEVEETPVPSPAFVPDPLDPTPVPMTTTVRIAQPVV